VNFTGCYAIKFHINGKIREILLDDLFPCLPSRSSPTGFVMAFSKSRGGQELWVQLLEKAWAKVNGNYENTITGLPSEALKALTGAPVEFYSHDFYTDSEMWEILKEANNQKYIISASSATANPAVNNDENHTPENLSKNLSSTIKDLKTVGLISDHAYSVISVHEIDNKMHQKLQLLKLRNPWGHQEWTGDWSDSS
jgi:calpain-15